MVADQIWLFFCQNPGTLGTSGYSKTAGESMLSPLWK